MKKETEEEDTESRYSLNTALMKSSTFLASSGVSDPAKSIPDTQTKRESIFDTFKSGILNLGHKAESEVVEKLGDSIVKQPSDVIVKSSSSIRAS